MYNEEAVLDHFFKRVLSVLKFAQMSVEIVCVNDGSTDETLSKLQHYQSQHPEIKIISFSRNFGKEAAMTAGIDYCQGDAVIPIDADLQDPPELILEMISKWREGFKIVLAQRSSRKTDTRIKRMTANIFYKLYNKLTHRSIPENVGDFRLMDKQIVETLKQLREKNRFMKGLFHWVGSSKTTIIQFEREERSEGKTKWNYWRLWNFALGGIFSFSSVPLRVWSYIGLIISLLSALYIMVIIVKTIFFGIVVPGYASIMVTILFMGGLQLLSLGIIGEYLSRVYDETKNRPIYVVEAFYE